MNIKFSFLIPAYNVEKYISQCLDSILQREKNDYEVIVINDGSTDGTLDICLKYQVEYPQFQVFSKENGGMVSARIEGLKHAKGEYYFFCDSDDYYDSELLNEFLDSIVSSLDPNELQCFSFRNVWPDCVEEESAYKDSFVYFDSLDAKMDFLSNQSAHNLLGYAVWDKLYSLSQVKSSNISPISKDELKNKDDWAEDLIFNLQYIMCVDRIIISDIPMYMLRKHGNKEQQNENGLCNRVQHMMNIMNALYTKNTSYQCDEYKEKFYKIVVWHLKRYIYLSIQANGVKNTRTECLDCEHAELFFSSVKKSLKDKNYFTARWDSIAAKDYKSLLKYILNGNMFIYKLKQYWIWKILPKLKKE